MPTQQSRSSARATDPRPIADEPEIALPTMTLIAAQIVAGIAVTLLWTGIGVLMGDPKQFAAAGAVGAGVITAAAAVTTIAGVPWIPKPASTALLAWLGCSVLRMIVSTGVLFLLYSAPFAREWTLLSEAKASLLLAWATTFLTGLLVEVGCISRHLRRSDRI